nr:cadherin-like beta sandwich domain-containing protein [Cohnella zeiphila]
MGNGNPALDLNIADITIKDTDAISVNADLSNLVLSNGTLSPTFNAATDSYTASVGNDVNSVTVTPTAADSAAGIKVNEIAVASGAASTPISLNVGNNPIAVKVTAEDGVTTHTYDITVNRAKSNNADLNGLTLSGASLNETFNSGTLNYTVTVGYATEGITVTPMVKESHATLQVNGKTVANGSASETIPLAVGDSNVITIVVTAEDGTTKKTYTVTVTRGAVSSNADLSNITLSNGDLTFDSAITDYTVDVSNETTDITVTPTAADATASIKVEGTAVNSGTASTPIDLNVGDNPITVEVTAQDGTTTKMYTVTVKRAPSSNAKLSDLTLSEGMLAFDPDTEDYTVDVGNEVDSITVTPTAADATASIKVKGTAVDSGAASTPIDLNVGDNPVTVEVTAQDGTTTQTYTVTVKRAPSNNAKLSGLTLSEGTISFDPDSTEYTVDVGNEADSITVTPTAADTTASIKVKGAAVDSGTASASIDLDVGDNVIPVEVKAQDGTSTKTYTITIVRAKSSNAKLSSLALSEGTLTFDPDTEDYTVNVGNAVDSITVTPTAADATASIKVKGAVVDSGTASAAIGLDVGDNVVSVEVTAQDGSTVKTYTLTVVRAKSSNAKLNNLTLSEGTLTFDPDTMNYILNVGNEVNSITVTPTAADAAASIKVEGTAVNSGTASTPIDLNVGDNPITVEVTAPDGTTTKTYTVTVKRAPSSNAKLSGLTLSEGMLAFDPDTEDYTVDVGNEVDSITVKPTAADATAGIKVKGSVVDSGSDSASIELNVGNNLIPVEVTAQDRTTTKTYTVTVVRAKSNNADLSGLSLAGAILNETFDSGKTDYTANVSYATQSIKVLSSVAESHATLKVDGKAVASGSESEAVSLTVGSGNVIMIEVTAQDGAIAKTYRVTVTREAPSSNADLSDLALSRGTLIFVPGTTNYTVNVEHEVSAITITPTAADSTAGIQVGSVAVISGEASAPINLSDGSNAVTIKVTAQDGTTSKTYTVTVVRAKSSNADLSGLTLSDGTLTPGFASDVLNYSSTVAINVNRIQLTATASDSGATIKVNGDSAVSGQPSGNIQLKPRDNDIEIVVTAADGKTKRTYEITVTRFIPNNPGTPVIPSNPTPPSNPEPPASNDGTQVIDVTDAANITETEKDGQKTTNVQLDEKKVEEKLTEGTDKPRIVIPAAASSDAVVGQMSGELAQTMVSHSAIVELRTGNAAYMVPADQIPVDEILSQARADTSLGDISIEIAISSGTPDQILAFEQSAQQNHSTVLVPPIDFTIRATVGNQTIVVKKFTAYVEREITIPDDVDPSQITTGVVLDENGQAISHVPTYVYLKDGHYVARINSLTNSTYTVISNPVAFKDVENHWAKEDVNDMGSRLIVKGTDSEHFNPDQAVTRAEFAAFVVRALGLQENGSSTPFSDVAPDHWAYGAVGKAVEYGLIGGYNDGTFRPDRTISREEALVVIARAMKIAGLDSEISQEDAKDLVNSFKDHNALHSWSIQAVAAAIRGGLVQGSDGGQLKPETNLSRAETAVLLRRMLQKAGLIN